ncbi:FH2-domain-containing protein [Trichoderma longibrachiatum ATCC 18648]|uniref:FH2-domain-containing protein n=1 Tax=Trichoderma longibrachiatum ATCC 18648 TaxID=983965 RepID=A0A2T4CAF4_TRILO|nr:FH2-domain-containing protein [Trichoderma longibrachiatum ATCC 18648]
MSSAADKSRQSSGGRSLFSRGKHRADKRYTDLDPKSSSDQFETASIISSRSARHKRESSSISIDQPSSPDAGVNQLAGVITSIPYDVPPGARSPATLDFMSRSDQAPQRREPVPHQLNISGVDFHQYPSIGDSAAMSAHSHSHSPARPGTASNMPNNITMATTGKQAPVGPALSPARGKNANGGPASSTTAVSAQTEKNLDREYDIVKCLKALMNNKFGADDALMQSKVLLALATCLISSRLTTRKLVSEILTFLCTWGSHGEGHLKVIQALDEVKTQSGENGRFDAWMRLVEVTVDGRGKMGSLVGASDELRTGGIGMENLLMEYAVATLILVNMIIDAPEKDLQMRVHIRAQFHACGIKRILTKMEGFQYELLDKQIDRFRTNEAIDYEDMLERENSSVKDNFDGDPKDLTDPIQIADTIQQKLHGTKTHDYFVSALQHLLLIRASDGEERLRMFQLVDSMLSYVAMDRRLPNMDLKQSLNFTVQSLLDKLHTDSEARQALDEALESRQIAEAAMAERDEMKAKLELGADGLVAKLQKQLDEQSRFIEAQRRQADGLKVELNNLQSVRAKEAQRYELETRELYLMLRDAQDIAASNAVKASSGKPGKDNTAQMQGILDRERLMERLQKQLERQKTQYKLEGRIWGDSDGPSDRLRALREAMDGDEEPGTPPGGGTPPRDFTNSGILDEVEKLFVAKEIKKIGGSGGKKDDKKQLISSDLRKAFEIAFAKFSQYSVEKIVQMIIHCDDVILTNQGIMDFLSKDDMCNINDNVAKQMAPYSIDLTGPDAKSQTRELDPEELTRQDQMYLYTAFELHHYWKSRMRALALTQSFESDYDEISSKMQDVVTVSESLRDSVSLMNVLGLILDIGNYMNDANKQARGFKLSSLARLGMVKDDKNESTLADLVERIVRNQYPEWESFADDITGVMTAQKINIEQLQAEAKNYIANVKNVQMSLDSGNLSDPKKFHPQDRVGQVVQRVMKEARRKAEQMQVYLEEMMKTYKDIMLFYGEDPSDENARRDFFTKLASFLMEWKKSRDKNIQLEETRKRNEASMKRKNAQTKSASLLADSGPASPSSTGAMDSLLERLRAAAPQARDQRDRRRRARLKDRHQVRVASGQKIDALDEIPTVETNLSKTEPAITEEGEASTPTSHPPPSRDGHEEDDIADQAAALLQKMRGGDGNDEADVERRETMRKARRQTAEEERRLRRRRRERASSTVDGSKDESSILSVAEEAAQTPTQEQPKQEEETTPATPATPTTPAAEATAEAKAEEDGSQDGKPEEAEKAEE